MKRLLLLITICISSVSFGQVPNYVPTNGLVGWWGFNGNANDESGNGNNGTVNGPVLTTDRFGNPNSAYSFDGMNDYIEISPGINLNTFTISFWFNSTANEGGLFSMHRQGSLLSSYQTSIFNGNPILYVTGTDNAAHSANGTNSVNDNNWHHYVGTYDLNNLNLYIDNILISSMPLSVGINQTTLNTLIGAWRNNTNSDYTYYFDGKIDDIGIWNRALTQCEISELYHAQTLSNPIVDLGDDTLSVCGTTTVLDATDNAISSYNWSTGESTSSITVNSSGEYTVEVTDTNGCMGYDTTLVSIIDPTITATVETICLGDSVTLSIGLDIYDTLLLDSYANNVNSAWNHTFLTDIGKNYILEINGSWTTGTYCPSASRDAAFLIPGFYGSSLPNPIENTIPCNDAVYCSLNCPGDLGRPDIDVYNPNHSYQYSFIATASSFDVGFVDFGGYGDNCGTVSFNLYELQNTNIITWSTGDTTSSITVQPTTTTTYSVTVSDGISSCIDDVTITVNDPQVNLGPDQDVCQGDSVLLDAGAGYDYYSWNTGDTTQSIYASQGGSYDATVGYQTPVSNNYSLEFDGDNKYISANDVTNQPTLLSVSAQVKLNSLTGHLDPQSFICEQGNNGVWRLAYDEPLQSYFFEVRIDNIHHTVYCGAELNEWVHLTGTYNRSSNTIKLFKNGVLQDELNNLPNLDLNSVSFPFTIGSRPNDPRSIIGRIDDVNIWNIELSQEQIQQYLNCPPTGNEPGLVGYWNFEEGSGTTATDLTSNGNDGTLVNGPIWSTDVPNQVCVSCTASDTVVINELLPTTSSISEVNCDSYTAPDGQTYTSTGNYTAVIPNAVGCDSTINIDLTITNSNSSSETVTECDSYTWSTNGQTYTQSGQYTEVLSNQDGCDSTVTLNLTIETVDITTQPLDQTVVVGNNGQFTVTTSATNPTFQWQMDDGTGWSNLSNAGQYSGTDTDVLTISNVQLNQNNFMYRCVVTSGNCETISSVARLTIQDNVGLDDINKNIFNVYPNPTSNSFTISTEKVINSNFRIMDSQGKEVLTGTMNGQEHTIDISKLSKGVYSVVFDNTEYPMVRVIKE